MFVDGQLTAGSLLSVYLSVILSLSSIHRSIYHLSTLVLFSYIPDPTVNDECLGWTCQALVG